MVGDRRVDTVIDLRVMRISHILPTANKEQEEDAIIILTTSSENYIPFVEEHVERPALKEHFPKLTAFSTTNSSNVTIKTRKDMPSQSIINKLLDLLNHKSKHFYHLPFKLTSLRKEER